MRIIYKLACLIILLQLSGHLAAQERMANVTLETNGVIRVGVLSESGKLLVPVEYASVVKNQEYFFVSLNNRWGCYSRGKLIIPMEYEYIGFKMPAEKIVKAMKNGKWGFVDTENRVVLDFSYDEACNFNNGKAYVKKGAVYMHIGKKGEVIDRKKDARPFCEEDATEAMVPYDMFEDGLLVIKEVNGKFGVLEKETNKVIIPFNYDKIGRYMDGVIQVRLGDKWGAYTDQGKIITEPLYDQIGYFL